MAIERTYQNIIRFNVGVHDVGFFEETQRDEKLVCIGADSANVETHILAKPFDYFTKIHAATRFRDMCYRHGASYIPQVFKHQT